MLRYCIIFLVFITFNAWGGDNMVNIAAGDYRPLYLSVDSPLINVSSFWLDKYPVTNREYQRFIVDDPKWQRGIAPRLFVEENYLHHWIKTTNQFKPHSNDMEKPVVFISWYAAQAYCQAKQKRLPTIAEWEYAAQASTSQKDGSTEKGYNQKILDWYAKASKQSLVAVGQDEANYWGVHNMHGLIWEWSDDFNSNLISGESRGDSSVNKDIYCASGSVGAIDPSDYAAFMRYGFRSSLNAKFTLGSLGFRCAADDKN